ncbi:MAG: carboxy-S-adenosyl-L-methionine synthase CmoA [Draconibacterium sp.]|nr:carboxy-S-adenosyl-L-methionine synthase CmoA [Draconibacterium sp.]
MNKDKVFSDADKDVTDFEFNKSVATVFEDMLERSVPSYNEIQQMIVDLTNDFAVNNTNVYDLGCSIGTTLINIDKELAEDISFVGVDNSDEMLKQCKANLEEAGIKRKITLENQDLNSGIELENASVVIFSLTLQFLRPLNREKIIRAIYNQLPENGAVIVVEKILTENSMLNRLFIEHYYKFKQTNGYSSTEISKKREALENVLVTYKLSENNELFLSSGFKIVETFFRWYNFSGFIAIK